MLSSLCYCAADTKQEISHWKFSDLLSTTNDGYEWSWNDLIWNVLSKASVSTSYSYSYVVVLFDYVVIFGYFVFCVCVFTVFLCTFFRYFGDGIWDHAV